MRPPAVMAFTGMLLATPLVGGHYFIDVFAGAGLALCAIAVTGFVGERSSAAIPALSQGPVAA